MASSSDFVAAAHNKRHFLQKQIEQLHEQAREFNVEIDRLKALQADNRKELAAYLLAEVDDDAIAALQERLQYPSLMAIKGRFEAQLDKAQRELAELEPHPEVEHYEFHRAQTQDELSAIEDAHADLKGRMAIWEASDHFVRLDAQGFFHPGYRPGLLQSMRDWRSISFLMADLERSTTLDFPTPQKVREVFVALRDEALPIFELHGDLQRRLEALDARWQRVQELRQAPDRLFEAMFGALSEAIAQHLESCPEALRLELASGDKHLTTFLKKGAGLSKQVQYLSELKTARLSPLMTAAETERHALEAKITKAHRKPRYYDDAEVQKMAVLKEDTWHKRHERLRRDRQRVAHFNKYQRGSVASDYLWWDVMTGGAPADDIYEVRTFRRQHPGWRYTDYADPWERHTHTPSRAIDQAAPRLVEDLSTARESDWAHDGS